jgi:hypothetical protein
MGFDMFRIASITFITCMLISNVANAEWINYSCYKNANQKGEETDKFYAYNESTRKVKLDRKEQEYSGRFRGNHITFELPTGKNKAEIDFNKADGHLTMTMVGGMFNGRKFNVLCFKDDTLQMK